MNTKYFLRCAIPRLSAAVCASLLATTAQAALLNLTLSDSPDIVSGFIDVSYDANMCIFSASGFAMELKDGGMAAKQITDGIFNLSATIDNSGTLIGGTLTIEGTIDVLGFNSGTLLTGALNAFGFSDGGANPLEFLFEVTGGDANGLYGSSGGIILGYTGFTDNFAADFNNLGLAGTGSGLADTAPLAAPVPAAFWLFGSGLMLLAGMTRRRRAN